MGSRSERQKDELRGLIESIEESVQDLESVLDNLDVDAPQSRDNDFSEPASIAENMMDQCHILMKKAGGEG